LKSFRRTKSATKTDSTPSFEIVATHFRNALEKKPVYENNRYGTIRNSREFKLVLKAH